MKKASRLVVLTLVAAIVGCGAVPVASDQPQPDKVLFDRGKQLLEDGKNGEEITLFETLINSYPDSLFTGRAKLALDDCALSQECNFYLTQIKVLPPGGGQIFFRNMRDEPPN